MIYELRTYKPSAGKRDALHARFTQHVLGLFARHGIEPLGFWEDKEQNLVYLVRFADMDARRAAWEGFAGDPEWEEVRARTEADGPLVDQIDRKILVPTAFSQLK